VIAILPICSRSLALLKRRKWPDSGGRMLGWLASVVLAGQFSGGIYTCQFLRAIYATTDMFRKLCCCFSWHPQIISNRCNRLQPSKIKKKLSQCFINLNSLHSIGPFQGK
jgi:hypothetical protein